MKTLQSFLKEFAIMPSDDDAKTVTPQSDDIQFDISGQDGDDDTVVATQPDDDATECVCQCECPCCQKNRDAQATDQNIEVIDPDDDKTVDFNIDDEDGATDDDDQDDPMKDYNVF